jgi:RimJ/RimL family protein N-acetyltransferase
MHVLDTARLVLRHLTADDAPFLVRLLTEPEVMRQIGDRGVRTAADAAAYLRDGPWGAGAREGYGMWRVARRADDAPVGLCGLLRRETLDAPDLGFAFLPEHRGQGYAREAGAAVLAHARDALGLARVVAVTRPDNAASQRVLAALGFAPEGTVTPRGRTEALALFGRALDGAPAPARASADAPAP